MLFVFGLRHKNTEIVEAPTSEKQADQFQDVTVRRIDDPTDPTGDWKW